MNGKTRPVLGLCAMSLLAILLITGFSDAATFSISAGDVPGFQNALTTAATNGEDDTINVSAGTFDLSSTLTYETSQAYSLTVSGNSAATTILDGGDSVRGNTIANNTIPKAPSGDTSRDGGGIFGYLFGSGGSVTIEGNQISNNSTFYGGGVFFRIPTEGDCAVRDNVFSGNVSGD